MIKQYRIIVDEEQYLKLPLELKLKAVAFFDDYDEHKDDPRFKVLLKALKKAKKNLEEYKFIKRHGGNT